MLEAAQNAVYDSGYCFKKGYSRSKRWSKGYEKETVKRPKLNKEIREKWIGYINEELNHLKQRIGFKEKRVTAAANIKNFKACDEITGEISKIKSKCHELEEELKLMLSKDKCAQRYQAYCHIKNTDSISGDQAESNDVPLST